MVRRYVVSAHFSSASAPAGHISGATPLVNSAARCALCGIRARAGAIRPDDVGRLEEGPSGHSRALTAARPLRERFTSPGSYSTARGIQETNVPYGSYIGKVPVYFPRTVRGVPEASLVLGLSLAGRQGHGR